MAAETETPIDEATGLPWLVLPPNYYLPSNRADIADDHHAFHPSTLPFFQTTAGEALRGARLQRTDWYDHHMVYHPVFSGPPIPDTEDKIFRTVVFAAARYIPDMAIDCNGYKPLYVPMPQEAKERIWRANELKIDRPGVVRAFLASYIVKQDISHVNEVLIEEFIDDKTDMQRRWFLGQWLLAQAAEVAVEPIKRRYRVAQKLGQIAPDLTTKPGNLVQVTLGGSFERNPFVKQLRERLAA